MNKPPLHYVLSNGAGYNFPDHFLPVVKQLLNNGVRVTFIQHDYFVTEHVRALFDSLKTNRYFSAKIVPLPSGFQSHVDFKYLLRFQDIGLPDVVLLTSDYTIWDRYLIKFCKENNVNVGLLQTNLLHIDLIRKHRLGEYRVLDRVQTYRSENGALQTLWKIISALGKRAAALRNRLPTFLFHHVVFPAILGFGVFLTRRDDKYSFCSGRTNFVLCRSAGDAEVLKSLKKGDTTFHHILMPRLSQVKRVPKNKKVLFLTSNVHEEMTQNCMSKWSDLAKALAEFKGITTIDLRLHPRINPSLSWPFKLKSKLETLGLRVSLKSSSDGSVTEVAHNYAGFVCAFSGTVRICREQSSGFVICILNASGRDNEESWMIGEVPGVELICSADELAWKNLSSRETVSRGQPLIEFLMEVANVR